MKDVDLSRLGFDVDKEIARAIQEVQDGCRGTVEAAWDVDFLGMTIPATYSPSTTRRGEVSFTHEAFFTLVAQVFGYAASSGINSIVDSEEFAAALNEGLSAADMVSRLAASAMEALGNPDGIESCGQLCEALREMAKAR